MSDIRKIVVTAKNKVSLTPLYREIDETFPHIDDFVEAFTVTEGVKPQFSSGEQVIERFELIWKVDQPDSEAIEIMERVIVMIKKYGGDDPDVIIDIDE